jgi:hypothetical protein
VHELPYDGVAKLVKKNRTLMLKIEDEARSRRLLKNDAEPEV